MKQFLAATLSLTFAASVCGASVDTASNAINDNPLANSARMMDGNVMTTASQACCWIFYYGQWWCVPCS